MDFIPDRTLYKAVMFARQMIRERSAPAGVAITRAAKYYGVSTSEVARYCGQVGGKVAGRRRAA
jgi:hypothetical protein